MIAPSARLTATCTRCGEVIVVPSAMTPADTGGFDVPTHDCG